MNNLLIPNTNIYNKGAILKIKKEDKMTIAREYIEGKSALQLAIKYSVCNTTISNVLKAQGINLRGNLKYPLNEHFFDIINSPEKAYFLGFLFADGHIDSSKKSVNMSLAEIDKDILTLFSNLLYKVQRPLILSNKGGEYTILNKRGKRQAMYTLYIHNKHIYNKLIDLGCVPRKTFLADFPEYMLKNRYLWEFIRGFFDGDGHVGVYSVKRSLRKYGRVTFVGTEKFLQKLKEVIKSELNIDSVIGYCHRTDKVKQLNINKQRDVLQFLSRLYRTKHPSLKRKYEKYLILKSFENVPLKKRTSNKKCVICGKPHKAKNYCREHYEKLIHNQRRKEKRRKGLISY